MRTLNIYIAQQFVAILAAAIGILTFGMLGGNLIQVFNYIAQGVPIDATLRFLLYIVPMVLTFTIPWGVLVSVLLLFGRMSADNAITALRACGVSIFQIISPVILLVFSLTLLCLFLQVDLAPRYLDKARSIVESVGVTYPESLIEPGKTFDKLGNIVVTVGDKLADNRLKDIQIFTLNESKDKLVQDIAAAEGRVESDREAGKLTIRLYNYTIIDYKDKPEGDRLTGEEIAFTIDIGKKLNQKQLTKDTQLMTLSELLGRTMLRRKLGVSAADCELALNMRLAMGLSPIAFLLLGLPLAIRTSRKETSVGLFLSVILAGVYFFSIIGCYSLTNLPQIHPELLLWIPTVAYQVGGILFLWKIARH